MGKVLEELYFDLRGIKKEAVEEDLAILQDSGDISRLESALVSFVGKRIKVTFRALKR